MKTLSSKEVCAFVKCTYRQLDYWVRIEHIPEDTADGSGTQRHWTLEQVRLAQVFFLASEIGLRQDILAEYAMEVLGDLNQCLWAFQYNRITITLDLVPLPKEWLDERTDGENLPES